ncbi:hypothetical protein GGS20DRAFT_163340 [Poronia punctata]|nr:hypothetical protein GGS20DRAFT_163340 [Poronia punctata]
MRQPGMSAEPRKVSPSHIRKSRSFQNSYQALTHLSCPSSKSLPITRLGDRHARGPSLDVPLPLPTKSVTDLRESFEKLAKPSGSLKDAARAQSNSKPPLQTSRRHMPKTTMVNNPPESPTGRSPVFGHWSAECLDASSQNNCSSTRLHTQLPKPGTFLKRLVEKGNGPVYPREEAGPQGKQIDHVPYSMDGVYENTTDWLPMAIAYATPRQRATRGTWRGGLLGIDKHPNAVAPIDQLAPANGKVSQLRGLFERSSRRISSSFLLTKLRTKSKPSTDGLRGTYASPQSIRAGPTLSTQAHTHGLSVVPSLTTEIPVNDFCCDFSDANVHDGVLKSAAPAGATRRTQPWAHPESPVKHCIQRFEHLSRESSVHSRANGAKFPPMPFQERNDSDKENANHGWRPMHVKGVALWRKISSSFSRSWDSLRDCPGTHSRTNRIEPSSRPDKHGSSPLSTSYLRHRTSDSFGHSLYRVSHTSRQHALSSRERSSSQFEDVLRSTNASRPRSRDSYHGRSSHSSHSPPYLQRNPATTIHAASRPRIPEFGLDGQLLSKHRRSKEDRSSSCTTPQGDPDALLKAMLKQSAVERNRRRKKEEYLHQEEEPRRLARWKDKGKDPLVDLASHSAERTSLDEDGGKKSDKGKEKGKGKGKERIWQPTSLRGGKRSDEQPRGTSPKTESGFTVFETKDVKLRHPTPSRPNQVRKMANMYKEKGNSGMSVNSNSNASSGTSVREGLQVFGHQASAALGIHGRKGGKDRDT